MVIKHWLKLLDPDRGFESSVISYGNQTRQTVRYVAREFESSVISYGNQTSTRSRSRSDLV